MNLTEFVQTVLDTRALTEDGLTFTIKFDEFGGHTNELVFTEDEVARPAKQLTDLAINRYNDLRMDMYSKYGLSWS